MDEIYSKMWVKARPYYEKGRAMDVEHILWMIDAVEEVCTKEQIDKSILMPLAILHDVGYAEVPKENPFNIDMRKAHMQAGAKIADTMLQDLNYPDEKRAEVSRLIAVHDNWALGDNAIYKDNPILSIFNDLDYIWMATPRGFEALMKVRNCTPQEMLHFLETNEKLTNRPFAIPATQRMFETYLHDRKREFVLQ